jgi:hypothetical protein
MTELIIFESEAYYKIMSEMIQAIEKAIKKGQNNSDQGNIESDWITLAEAQKILPYKSKTTWQKFRDQGIILFTQNERSILYSRKSILAFLNKNTIKL